MTGVIDAKGIRESKGQQTLLAYAASGAAAGEPAVITASTDGTFVATPAHISATTNLVVPGHWGIAAEAITANAAGRYVVAGVAKMLDTATSGYMVLALSANGSILASAAVGSGTNAQGLGKYASSLLDNAGGLLIW